MLMREEIEVHFFFFLRTYETNSLTESPENITVQCQICFGKAAF